MRQAGALLTPLLAFFLSLTAVDCGGGVAAQASDAGTDAPSHDAGVSYDATPLPDTFVPHDAAPEAAGPLPSALLLFAGDGPQFFDDTWEYSGLQWLSRTVKGPPARYDHAMAALGGKIVLFGGSGEAGYLGDTWEWDGTSWTQKNVAGPPARGGHRMATVGNKVVLFGGSGDASANLCDTWEWDGAAWTQTAATLTTGLHCIGHAVEALGGTLYLFGGVGAYSDTWAYDGTKWTQVSTVGPPGRSFTSMTRWSGGDPGQDRIVLFGGEADANHILADTWTWDGTKWTKATPASSPPARWHAGMASFEGKVFLFGGDSGTGWLGDTWTWDGATWTQVTGNGPSARYTYTLAAR